MLSGKRNPAVLGRIAYGAWHELEKYGHFRLNQLSTPRGLHWQHGWLPVCYNQDPDLIVGEDGRAHFQTSDAFFVAKVDQEISLKALGFPAVRAIGLPFAYALLNQQSDTSRNGNSLLIMPGGHSTDEEGERRWDSDSEYIAYSRRIVGSYKSAYVVLHSNDILLERQNAWRAAGFKVLRGAGFGDISSLSRLAEMFRSFESVTTNAPGSHIVYAAAAGCRVSISGPTPPPQDLSGLLYHNRPDLVPVVHELDPLVIRNLKTEGLYSNPEDAVTHLNWGATEIGLTNTLRPDEVATVVRGITRFPPETKWTFALNIPYLFRVARRIKRALKVAR